MPDRPFPKLDTAPALERPDLLGPPVLAALEALVAGGAVAADAVSSAPIDGDLSDTSASIDAYGITPRQAANCVVVKGTRGGEERVAALVVLASTRADVNGTVRRLLDVRKCSFLGRDDAVERTGMEFGGIGPIGLPASWRVLLDARVATAGPVIVGSGIRPSKIAVDGAVLAALPGVEVVEGLAQEI